MNKYFCIFGGGGIRGASYPGALRALDELGIEITGFGGSSIGAVVAGLVTFGYTKEEIQEIFNSINFNFFKDLNFNFGKDFAFSKGENFYEWIKEKIETKFYKGKKGDKPVCFKDIDKELVIFSVDLISSKFHEFSKNKTPDVEIAYAIRVSVAMPGLYAPVNCKEECLVDGDLIKAMPLAFVSDTIFLKKEKILEFRLENNEEKRTVSNTFEYLNAVYDTISGFASDFIINSYKNCDNYDCIKIDLKNTSVVDFMVNKEKKLEMANKGYFATINYFKNEYREKRKYLNSIYLDLLETFKKIKFLIKNNEFEEAKIEISEIFSNIIYDFKNLDEKITVLIYNFKKAYFKNFIIKKTFFGKKAVLIDFKATETMCDEILEKLTIKLNP